MGCREKLANCGMSDIVRENGNWQVLDHNGENNEGDKNVRNTRSNHCVVHPKLIECYMSATSQ